MVHKSLLPRPEKKNDYHLYFGRLKDGKVYGRSNHNRCFGYNEYYRGLSWHVLPFSGLHAENSTRPTKVRKKKVTTSILIIVEGDVRCSDG